MKSNRMNEIFDVIIIGGSYSGLAAGMALGRALRKVLIIDSQKPCNRYTPHSHNFITQDGNVPGQIAAVAKQQVQAYESVQFLDGIAVRAEKKGSIFHVSTHDNAFVSASKLIFATGIRDVMPDLPGFEACWGKTVIHCPYCHGNGVCNGTHSRSIIATRKDARNSRFLRGIDFDISVCGQLAPERFRYVAVLHKSGSRVKCL